MTTKESPLLPPPSPILRPPFSVLRSPSFFQFPHEGGGGFWILDFYSVGWNVVRHAAYGSVNLLDLAWVDRLYGSFPKCAALCEFNKSVTELGKKCQ